MALTRVRAKLSGTWVALTYNSATGRYEGYLTPSAPSLGQPGGYYSIDVEAANAAGQTAAVSGANMPGLRLVVEDKTAPTLTVKSPADGLVTVAASVTVSGTASDSGGLKGVTVNGSAVTVAANGGFSTTVSLANGQNTITVTATDNSGNTSTVSRTVTKATQGPITAITSPSNGAILGSKTVTVTGTVSDAVSPVVGVTVNGTAAAVSGGTFTAGVTLQEGQNTITAVAVNQVGLSTMVSVSVTVDTAAPQISLTSPTAGLMVKDAAFLVTGTVSDSGPGVASVTVNGAAAALAADGTFSANITGEIDKEEGPYRYLCGRRAGGGVYSRLG